jgi:glyoxylase-like metal-dependent hydrolase (beta-lactamase superfamily II)
VVNTHHHFDHCFGNATLAGTDGCPIWAHEEAARYLRERGEDMRRAISGRHAGAAGFRRGDRRRRDRPS